MKKIFLLLFVCGFLFSINVLTFPVSKPLCDCVPMPPLPDDFSIEQTESNEALCDCLPILPLPDDLFIILPSDSLPS